MKGNPLYKEIPYKVKSFNLRVVGVPTWKGAPPTIKY